MTSETSPVQPARARAYVRFARALVRTIVARVADGESLVAICGGAGMPSRNTVTRWAREHPRIGEALDKARVLAGRVGGSRGGAPRRYCMATAEEIFTRVAQGETMTSICADPAMPHAATVARWRCYEPVFDEALRVAQEAAAEGLCDEALAVARGVTRESAYADHVRLTHLRWLAAVRAPQLFGRVKAMEAPVETRKPEVAIRHFKVETREDGMVRMVSLVADPTTGGVVRDSEGEWGPPRPDHGVRPKNLVRIPAGGGSR